MHGLLVEADIKTVAVVGMGYPGLTTAIHLLESGAIVIGYDTSELLLTAVKSGRADLRSEDRQRLRRHVRSGSLTLTTDVAMVRAADAVVVCVPIPVDHNLDPDLTALADACDAVVRHAVPGQVIMSTSTTYIGCTWDHLIRPLRARGFAVGADVFVAFGPERIGPGRPHEAGPRVVGGVTGACADRAERLARLINPIVHRVSSVETAETVKLLENTFRAVNIAFVSEFADACAEVGLGALEVIKSTTAKPYGFMPFYTGSGVGGRPPVSEREKLVPDGYARHRAKHE
jgi:UDP-N-acetyl-D-glucosamine dehydrogenase